MATYDVVVIGGGPGGYVAAIRAAQLGLKAALVEKEAVGGLCLNWGCIPSKALLRSAELIENARAGEEFGLLFDNLRTDLGRAVDRSRQVVERMVKGVEFLLKQNGVAVLKGEASLRSPRQVAVSGEGKELLETENVIIATGARARTLPGVEIDGQRVITSNEGVVLREPPEHAIIIGGGPIGVEFAYLWHQFGSRVTVVEMLDHLLPSEDEEVAEQLERAFKKKGIAFLTGARVEGVQRRDGKLAVRLSGSGLDSEVTGDLVLVGAGMTANTEGLNLEGIGVAITSGFITIDERMQTSVPGVYAIGDVTGKLLLAHVASAQGVVAAEAIAGRQTPVLVYEDMPRATYCRPQVASVGLTEREARRQGLQVKTGTFPMRANGKAMALGETEGLVKVVVDAEHGEILGAHLVGPEVTELVSELSLARVLEATVSELGFTVHPHPTLSETVKEAALAARGEAIHFITEARKTVAR